MLSPSRGPPVCVTNQNQRPPFAQQVSRMCGNLIQRDIPRIVDMAQRAGKFPRPADVDHQWR
jgi:hypothetical protein